MTVSAVLAQALAARRTAYNARVAVARRAQPGFDVAALKAAVREQLDPLIGAVAAVAPDRIPATAAAAFDMMVTLVGQRLIGPAARNPHVNRLWAETLPAYARLIAEQPVTLPGSLTNAVVRLAATPGVRVEEWLATMGAMAPLADAATVPAIGQIVAWRVGMAQYRAGALRAADTLPEPVALAAVGGEGDWTAVRAAFAASRWWSPTARPTGIVFGGFTGFGGPFPEPPVAAAAQDGFLVRAGGRYSLLIADGFGATLHPASEGAFDGAAGAMRRLRTRDRTVEAEDRTIAVDLPAEGLVAVANEDSIAITSPYSHFVLVQPARLP